MTQREYFENNPGNLGWCCCCESSNERIKLVRCEGKIISVIIDNEEGCINPELIKEAAKIACGDDYDLYSGYTDEELLNLYTREIDCSACPHFEVCDTMDEEIGE